MYKDKDGKIEEPTMYNIKGGGEWYDASYHGLLVHRDYELKNTKVKVLKVKFQNLGENGAEAFFTWEPKSGCFIPDIAQAQRVMLIKDRLYQLLILFLFYLQNNLYNYQDNLSCCG